MWTPVRLVSLFLLSLMSAPSLGADVTSTLIGSGDWNNDSIWDSTLHPNNGNGDLTYDAVINGGTVSLPALTEIEIEALFLHWGTLSGAGTLTHSGASQWTNGILAGPTDGSGQLTLAGTGELTVSGSITKYFQGAVTNAGTLVWQGGQNIAARGSGPNTFTNTGVIDLQGEGWAFEHHSTLRPGVLINAAGGTLKRSVGTGTALAGMPVENHGTIEVQSGALNLAGGVSGDGVFRAESGARLQARTELIEGTWEAVDGGLLDLGVTFVGSGARLRLIGAGSGTAPNTTLQWNNGFFEVTDGAAYAGTTEAAPLVNLGEIVVGAGSTINGNRPIENQNLLRGSGTIGKLIAAGGEVRGETTLHVEEFCSSPDTTTKITGNVSVDSATFTDSVIQIEPNAKLIATGSAVQLVGGELQIQGTFDGDLASTSSDQHFSTISGTGTITGNLSLSGIIGSEGTLNVQGDLTGGGELAQGRLHVAGETRVDGLFRLAPTTTLDGAGDVRVTGTGELTVDNVLDRNVRVTGGILQGNGTITGNLIVSSGLLRPHDLKVTGDLQVTGETVIPTFSALDVAGETTINDTLTIASGAVLRGAGDVFVGSTSTLVVNGSTTKNIAIDASRLEGHGGSIAGNVTINSGTLASVGTLAIEGEMITSGTTTIESGEVSVHGRTPITSGVLVVGEDAVFSGDGLIEMTGGTIEILGVVEKNLAVQGEIVAIGRIDGGIEFVGDGAINGGGDPGGAGFGLICTSFSAAGAANVQMNVTSKIGLVNAAGTLQINAGANYDKLVIGSDGHFVIDTEDEVVVGDVTSPGTLAIGADHGAGSSRPSNVKVGKATVGAAGTLAIDTSSDVQIDQLDLQGVVLPNPGGGKLVAGSLGGPGTVAIDVTGRRFSPGNSPGRLAFSSAAADALTIALEDVSQAPEPAPTFTFEINDAAGTIGADPGWDALIVADGGVTLDASASSDFVIEVLSLGLDNAEGALTNFAAAQPYTWRFIETAVGFHGTPLDEINFIVDDSQFAAANGVGVGAFSVVQDTPQSLALQYTPQPVPGDFDNDGLVNGRDFLAWQRGVSPTPLSSDDLAEWQAAYGDVGSPAGAVNVPEPDGAATITMLLAVMAINRRSRM